MMSRVSLLFLILRQVNALPQVCNSLASCRSLSSVYHIPGPNPIVYPRRAFNASSWAGLECEVAGGLVAYEDEFFLVYHCLGSDEASHGQYQVGMSSARTPLGPFTPVDKDKPLLGLGPIGSWDDSGVASFNMIPMPTAEQPRRWIGFYEGVGATSNYSSLGWQMGIAESLDGPRGPWTKHASNPVMNSKSVCGNQEEGGIRKRTFDGTTCNGMYIAAVHYGSHTGGKIRMYMEAPINQNDEGPLAAWEADDTAGPYRFRHYILDGGLIPGPRTWDQGRYSESRVDYDPHSKMWHLWATGSPNGNPTPSKYHENIGWAFSSDGFNFTQFHGNPTAVYSDSTPHTLAMAEGHSFMDPSRQLVYVYHTIRWDDNSERNWIDGNKGYYFVQPPTPSVDGGSLRNAEDIGVDMFVFGPEFVIDAGKSRITHGNKGRVETAGGLPLITRNWRRGAGLTLKAGAGANTCAYDWATESFCTPFRAVIESNADAAAAVSPLISLRVVAEVPWDDAGSTTTAGTAIHVGIFAREYDYDYGVGKIVWSWPDVLLTSVGGTKGHEGIAAGVVLGDVSTSKWMVATVELQAENPSHSVADYITNVEMFLGYDSSTEAMQTTAVLV